MNALMMIACLLFLERVPMSLALKGKLAVLRRAWFKFLDLGVQDLAHHLQYDCPMDQVKDMYNAWLKSKAKGSR